MRYLSRYRDTVMMAKIFYRTKRMIAKRIRMIGIRIRMIINEQKKNYCQEKGTGKDICLENHITEIKDKLRDKQTSSQEWTNCPIHQ